MLVTIARRSDSENHLNLASHNTNSNKNMTNGKLYFDDALAGLSAQTPGFELQAPRCDPNTFSTVQGIWIQYNNYVYLSLLDELEPAIANAPYYLGGHFFKNKWKTH